MPKFSIIIISYNSSLDLENVFSCLAAQKYRDFEIILIDNSSPINPPNASQIEKADIYIANQENIGFARANNQAAKIAKGEFLILLNPDAFPKPDFLLEINKAINKYPNCDNFGALQLDYENNKLLDGAGDCYSIIGIAWRGGYQKPIPEKIEDGEVFSTCGAASVWRASRFKELNGFEESFNSYFEDVDLGFRHRLLGGNSIQLTRAIVYHKGSSSSGRYSYYSVFNGNRNRILAYIRLMPMPLFIICAPLNLLATLLLFLHAIYRGAGKPYFMGIKDAIKNAKPAFEQRKFIQSKNNIKLIKLMRMFSYSPISILKRQIVIRKIK